MIRTTFALAMLSVAIPFAWAQQTAQEATQSQEAVQSTQPPAKADAHAPLRERLQAYLDCFNSGDAAALAGHWTEDGLSVSQETGEQTSGRQALQEEFAAFFAANPGARLTGEVSGIRQIRPDVVSVEGQTTLFVSDAEPVQSAFTAVLVKEGDQWLISSSHERDLPAPATSYDALKELQWLIGTWEDQTEGRHQVTTSVRWSPHQAFLLRSFSAQFEDAEPLEGTQIIGWDPLNKQIRTWTFNSDGSFGQGTVSRHNDDYLLKMWQITGDGQLAAGTKVFTRVDGGTISVQTIGETVDGAPVPTSDPVTVVRVADAAPEQDDADAAAPAPASPEGDPQ